MELHARVPPDVVHKMQKRQPLWLYHDKGCTMTPHLINVPNQQPATTGREMTAAAKPAVLGFRAKVYIGKLIIHPFLTD